MPVTANDYLKNLRFVINALPAETNKIVYKNEVEIIELNTEQQLFRDSVNVFGHHLGYYAHDYQPEAGDISKGYPKIYNQPYNFVKTGLLFSEMNLRLNGYVLFMENTDSAGKNHELELMSGAFIGLTTENQKVVNWEIIYPELMDFINKYV
jgi:hypothetical protein